METEDSNQGDTKITALGVTNYFQKHDREGLIQVSDIIFDKKEKPKVDIQMFNVKTKGGYPDKITPLIYEIIGTAFLIIAVNWGAAAGPI